MTCAPGCTCWRHPCECSLNVICGLHVNADTRDCCAFHECGGSVVLSCLSLAQLRSAWGLSEAAVRVLGAPKTIAEDPSRLVGARPGEPLDPF